LTLLKELSMHERQPLSPAGAARPDALLASAAGRRGFWRQKLGLAVAALSAVVITACGGGGTDSASTPSSSSGAERATAFAAGPITGFGSVIVNGVRYDDSAATVSDDDDRARSREQLKLGMMVEVEGAGLNAQAGTGRALRIRFGSQIVGPVDAVDAAAGTLTVLGQAVIVTDTTVIDDSLVGGLAALTAGTVVEVHAQFNAADGTYTAMRIEDDVNAATYKLRGVISQLDTTAKTFALGGQTINYSAVTELPNNLADGLTVRVRLQTAAVNGQWMATAVSTGRHKPDDGQHAHLRGAVTVFTSSTSFEINGLLVDASTASFPDGAEGVVLGAVVEVEGSTVNGVLVATKVELDGRHARERHEPELHGLISQLDTAAKTFVLRGITVWYGGDNVAFKDGSEADLANDRRVEVKGLPSDDRTRLEATKIEFE
jgi:hypothetical protein